MFICQSTSTVFIQVLEKNIGKTIKEYTSQPQLEMLFIL